MNRFFDELQDYDSYKFRAYSTSISDLCRGLLRIFMLLFIRSICFIQDKHSCCQPSMYPLKQCSPAFVRYVLHTDQLLTTERDIDHRNIAR